jgi:nucleoside 2-deoxyribosyltransferase
MYLQHIRIPLPHALAYSKLISFLGRYNTEKKAKAVTDLHDFVNLSNHDEFCISRLFNLIRQNNAKQYIQTEMARLAKDSATRAEILAVIRHSCVSYFANICPGRQAQGDEYNQSMRAAYAKKPKRSAYFAAPHKNVQHNTAIADELKKIGIGVKLPHDEVERVYGIGMPSRPRVRQVCIDAILSSDWLIVDADRYGLDCAWEIGFADGLGKYVIGLNEDLSLMSEPRMINRRQYLDNFMHGWDDQTIFETVEQVAELFRTKVIYICGPFKNKVMLSNIKQDLESRALKVIFPMDNVPDAAPKDYPLRTRDNAIHQIDAADVVLVILPRYGMDSSWQIGYATAKKKEIVGLMTPDDNAESVFHSLWDQLMHGWREKDILTGMPKLRAAMEGFIGAEII